MKVEAALPQKSEASLEALRREFDQSFTLPPRAAAEELENFVLLEAGGQKLAVALEELVSLEHELTLVPVPSRAPAMLGVAARQGRVLVVFDLGMLLGFSPGMQSSDAAWWQHAAVLQVRVGAEETLGLRFDRLLQFARVPAGQVHAAGSGGQKTVEYEGALYPVPSLAAMVRRILE